MVKKVIDNSMINREFRELSTPLIADACLRLNIAYNVSPSGLRPIIKKTNIAGKVQPVKHFGSVDVFLEALSQANKGDILVIDNDGRLDEGCIGDLTVLETEESGLSGLILWGVHRDTNEIREIKFPTFTYGSCPSGPQRLDHREGDFLNQINFGISLISRNHTVFADDDGAIFVLSDKIEEIIKIAKSIKETERIQAKNISQGNTLKKQLKFDKFLEKKQKNTSYTFREHLKEIGGAIEE